MGWFDPGEVRWLAVAVATLAAFVVSFLWYHPRALGTAWARHAGVDGEGARAAVAPRIMAAVVFAVTAAVMCVVQAELLVVSVGGGLLFGAGIGLLLRLLWGAFHGAHEARPAPLMLIDAAHDVVALAVIGAVVGAFL